MNEPHLVDRAADPVVDHGVDPGVDPARPGRRWAVLFNPGSGHGEPAGLRAAVAAALAARAIEAAWYGPGPQPGGAGRDDRPARPAAGAALPDEAAAAATAVIEGRADTLLAVGGDGTVNAAAQALWRAAAAAAPHPAPGAPPGPGPGLRPALAIVPAGTFNHVARRYGLVDDVEQAVAMAAGDIERTVWLGGGAVNGRLFLNNCSFGAYTTLIEAREAHKRRFGRYRIVAALSALATLAQRHRRQAVILEHAGGRIAMRASLVFVGANPLQLEPVSAELAAAMAGGHLGLVAVRAPGTGGVLAAALRALLARDVAALDEFSVELIESATLHLRRRRVKVVLDGEIATLPTPLRLEAVPRAVRLAGAVRALPDAAAASAAVDAPPPGG